MKTFRSFIQDEEGQSTTEYILILAVVVMVALKFKNVFGTKLTDMLTNLGGKMDGAMQE